jgi:hypothetical protein
VNQQTPNTGFEERLLTQLQSVVAERGAAEAQTATAASPAPAWRSAPRLALGGAVAAVAVATAMIVSAGGDNTQAAFAVEPQAGGGVNLEIYSLSDADGLEGALEEAGIRADVTYLPAGMTCREPRFQASTLTVPPMAPDGRPLTLDHFEFGGLASPLTISIGDEESRHKMFEAIDQGSASPSSIPNLTLNPEWFAADQSLVITGAPSSDSAAGDVGKVQVATGDVAPCNPVPAPTGDKPLGQTFLGG